MTAEVELYNAPPAMQVAHYQSAAVERLGQWATSAEAAYRVAEKLVQSSFVPASFARKPMEAAAAILAGMEVGLSPMAALRSFDVIQGQAAPRALALRAIAQSFGHDLEIVETTATRCVVRGRRRGSPTWQTVTWTIDRAKDMQLVSKDNWKKQPQAMLVARATAEMARLIAADAILGVGYSAEEIADGATGFDAAPPLSVVPDQPAPGVRRMSRKPAAQPVAEPAAEEPADDDDPLVDPQSREFKRLHALLNEHGYKDRDRGLAYMADTLGRDVASSKDLRESEVARVIAALVAVAEESDPWAAQDEAPDA